MTKFTRSAIVYYRVFESEIFMLTSLLHYLLKVFAQKIIRKYHPDVVGITGSVGKTLTQNAIASVLSQKFKVVVGEELINAIKFYEKNNFTFLKNISIHTNAPSRVYCYEIKK